MLCQFLFNLLQMKKMFAFQLFIACEKVGFSNALSLESGQLATPNFTFFNVR